MDHYERTQSAFLSWERYHIVASNSMLISSLSWGRKICFSVEISAAFNLTVSSAAIDSLDETRKKSPEEAVALCHFYFKYDDKDRQTGEQVARSLLKQLVYQIYQIDILPPAISLALEKLYIEAKTGMPPKQLTVIDLFISSCNYFNATFVFLDGLDECTSDTQNKIINLIRRFCESGVRVFLTSQPQLIPLVMTLKVSLGTFESTEIIADKDDLKTYIQQRFDLARNKAGLDETLLNKLVAGAEGM